MFGVGCETRPAVLSQQAGEAGGSLTSEVRGRAGSSLDNAGTCQHRQMVRVRQARREGATQVNQWQNPLKRGNRLLPDGCGPGSSARQPEAMGKATLPAAIDAARGGHGESLRRSRGEAAGAELGISLVDRDMVNMGTVRVRPCTVQPGRWRAGAPSTVVHVRGGAVVVVRGR